MEDGNSESDIYTLSLNKNYQNMKKKSFENNKILAMEKLRHWQVAINCTLFLKTEFCYLIDSEVF